MEQQEIKVEPTVCVGCGVCVESCPTDVLRQRPDGRAEAAFPEDCQYCFLCVFDCPVGAIALTIPRVSTEPRWWDHWLDTPEV